MRSLPKKAISLVLIAMFATVGLFSSGCATTDDDVSELPWNTPQSWEGSPLIPGMDRQ